MRVCVRACVVEALTPQGFDDQSTSIAFVLAAATGATLRLKHTQQSEHLLRVRLRSGLLAARQAGGSTPGRDRHGEDTVSTSAAPTTPEAAVIVKNE